MRFKISLRETVHCQKFIVKFTKYLDNFRTKISGNLSKPVCIFYEIAHTFTPKYFGTGVTKINSLSYKRNMRIMVLWFVNFTKIKIYN